MNSLQTSKLLIQLSKYESVPKNQLFERDARATLNFVKDNIQRTENLVRFIHSISEMEIKYHSEMENIFSSA